MLDFAEGLCDDVTVLRQGRVAYSGTIAEFGDPRIPLETRVLAAVDERTPGPWLRRRGSREWRASRDGRGTERGTPSQRPALQGF
jgi:ABC-type multidrug transport system ATPase subunit